MSWLPQIRKYATVGIGSAITDLSIYGMLTGLAGLSPEVANLISRPCGGLFSFTFNKLWTFERRELAGTRRQLLRFWMVWLVSYALSELLVWGFHQFFTHHESLPTAAGDFLFHMTGIRAGMTSLLPKLCAEGLICIGLFLSHRFWTFRHH